MKQFNFQSRFLILLLGFLTLGISQAWGADDEELFTIESGDVVNNSGYAKYEATVEDRGWIITFGGNNKSVGTNSGNRSKCNLSSYSKYAVSPVTTSYVASAFVSTTSISDVSKISYTFSGGKNQTNTNVYLIYSSDGNTFSQVSLTSGTQGATISSGTAYEFTKCSGYFGLLFKATNSSGDWRIDDVKITFYKAKAPAAKTYAISTNSPANGSIQFSTDGTNWNNTIAEQIAGADVYFKLVPQKGYALSGTPTVSNVAAGGVTDLGEGKYRFTMPASAVIVSATFAAKQTINITANAPDGGTYTVQVDDQTPITVNKEKTIPAYDGAVITMTSTADETHKLQSTPFEVKDADGAKITPSKSGDNYTFTMPNKGVTVTAKYSATYSITAAECTNGSITKITDKDGNVITRTSLGSKVIVNLSANNHYHIKSVYYIKEDEEEHTDIAEDEGVYSFTMVASNVTVYAEFEEDTKYIVTFNNNGSESSTKQVYAGDPIGTLPTLNSTDACDPKSTTFAGWTSAAWEGKVASFDNFVTPEKTVDAAMTLNAVWAESVVTPSTTYSKITSESDLTEGNYVFAYQYNSGDQIVLKNTADNSSPTDKLEGVKLTLSDNKYSNPDAAYIWYIAGNSTDGYTLYNDAVKKYVNATTSAATLSNTGTKFNLAYSSSRWTAALKSSSTYYLHGYVSGSNYDFRVSTSGSGANYKVYLYKQETTTGRKNFITTCSSDPLIEVSPASLSDFSTIATTGNPSAAQSFTVEGYNLTEDITISVSNGYEICQTENGTYSKNIILTQSDGKVAKTTLYVRLVASDYATKTGEATGTITIASEGVSPFKEISLSGTVVAAVTVTFNNNGSTDGAPAAIKLAQGGTLGSNLPGVGSMTAPISGYTFVGWVADGDKWNGFTPSLTKSLITGNEIIDTDITYDAVWAKSTNDFELMGNSDPFTDGNYIITYNSSSNGLQAMGNVVSSSNITTIEVDDQDEGIISNNTEAKVVWTLHKTGTNTVTFYNADKGQYLQGTSSALSFTNTPVDWTWSMTPGEEGYAPKYKFSIGTNGLYYLSNEFLYHSSPDPLYIYKQQISNFFVTIPDEYTVTWHKGNAGTKTTAFEGQTFADIVADAPSVDDNAAGDCANKFMGWATSAITKDEATEKDVSWAKDNTTPISGNVEYYAVFAYKEGGSETKSYGFEDTDDASLWVIDGPTANTTSPHSGSKSGMINSNNTYVQFKNKVNVTSFSYWFTRGSNNNNYNVYIETSTTGGEDDWTAVDTKAMSTFNSNGSYSSAVSKVFDGNTALYVRFHCSNTTAVRYVDDISITYGNATYSNYVTQCTPTYTVNFFINSGDAEPYATQKVEENQKATAPDPAPTKAGATLGGWFTANDEALAEKTITEPTDFIAKWEYITPSFSGHPENNAYIQNGGAAAMTVEAAAGDATLSYQWQVSTTSSTGGFEDIAEATTTSYTPSTAVVGNFYYRCQATNGDKVAYSNVATIAVNPITQCYTPTITIGDGSYFIHSATVTLATQTEGASIYYTTDGNTPSATSTLYEEPFTISETTTIMAIAVKTNMTNSFKGTAIFSKAALIGIEIKTAPTKVTYDALETFAPAGLVITANYESNLSEDIAYSGHESEFSFEPALDAQLHETNTTVQITWNGQSVNQTITVTRVLTGISDATTSATFYEGGQVKATDFTCTYNYNDGDPVTAQAVELISLNGTDFAASVDIPLGQTGEKTITVKKGTFTTTVTITVNEKAKHMFVDRVNGNATQTFTDGYTVPTGLTVQTACEFAPNNNVFKGWIDSEFESDVITDADLLSASSQTATANKTYYAVWAEHKEEDVKKTISKGDKVNANFTSDDLNGNLDENIQYNTEQGSGTTAPAVYSSCIRLYKPSNGNSTGGKITFKNRTGKNATITAFSIMSTGASSVNYEAGSLSGSLSSDNNTPYIVEKDGLSSSSVTVLNTKSDAWNIKYFEVTYTISVESDANYISDCVAMYELTFDANGGTGTAPEAILLKEGGKVNLPNADGLSKAYNTFSGWNTAAEGTGTHYDVDAEYTMGAEDAVLYAEWTPRAVTALEITYEATNTEFGIGQTFSAEGLTVKATYEGDETEENVAFTTNYDNHVFTEDEVGNGKTVTITYKEGSTTYTIDVKAYPKAEFYVFGEHYNTYVCKEDVVALAFPAIPSSEHLVYKNFVGWSATAFDATEEEPTLVSEGADFTDGAKFYAVFGRASEYEEKTTTITRDKCNTGESTGYDWYPWTADGISGEIDLYATTKANMQMKHKDGRLGIIFSNVATPGKILSISATKESSGTTRTWDAYVSATAFSESTDVTALTSLGAKDVNTTPVTWSVTDETARFFLLQFATGGGTNIDNFTVTYLSPVIYSWTTNWVEPDHVRTGLTYDQAGTICLPYAVKADDYKGASVWSIENKTGTSTMITSITLAKEVEDDGITKKDLEAGKPYIFFAEESEFQLFYSGNEYKLSENENKTVEANGLFGNLDVNPIVINPTEYVPGTYLINQNKLMECGTNCNVPQYRAYVKAEEIGKTPAQAPVSAPRRVIGNPSGTPTNLNGLNGNGKAQKALIDGHIYILRDNKMYNAQGLFVK